MNWSKIAAVVDNVAGLAEEFAPAAAVAGPEGAAIGALISKAAAFVKGVADEAANAGEAISSGDLATIQAADAKMFAADAALSKQIDAS